MKSVIAVLLIALGAAIGGGIAVWYQHQDGEVTGDGEREILYYRNPMDPSITSPVPRKDHMGMDYIPVYAGEEDVEEPGVVRISPGVMQSMSVRVTTAEQGDLQRQVRTVGFVDYDERGLGHVHLRTEGWIEDLRVRTTGERVEAGQLLFRLYSPVLVNAQEELLQVVRRGSNVTPARERLRALGMSAEEIRAVERSGEPRQLISVRAQHGGIVQALNVREGMYVTPATEVMSIADLSRVWVQADLFEHQVDAVAAGSVAEVELPFRPGEVLSGEVEYIYPALATPTRTVRARLVFANQEGQLKPGMYADVRLEVRPLTGVVHVPAEAVIRTGQRDRVIIALGEGRFEGREVQVGRRAGDRLEIIEGLEAGERVVSSGHFLIDSETRVGADMRRMDEAGPLEEPVPEIWSEAEVNAIDREVRKINLTHEPIPELQWPAMTMDFSVAEEVDLDAVEPGMQVRFRVIEGGELGYTVTAIEPVNE